MKAIFFRSYGGPEVLEYGDLPDPVPGDNQVLIDVHASAVNPRDWMLRAGTYVGRPLVRGWPKVPGSDVSGVIAAVGRDVRRWKAGDEVFGMQTLFGNMGGYAEKICIDQSAIAHKPADVSHVAAAATPVAALTALQALEDLGRVGEGSRVVVVGAAGGVGHYAVQIARIRGAEVTGVCSAGNVKFVRGMGAARIIDYREERFNDVLDGQDVVFDTIGMENLASCRGVLASNGTYITTIPGPRTAAETARSMVRERLGLGGRRARVIMVAARGADLERIGRWLASGELRSEIAAEYPLEEAAEAQRQSRTFRTRGKIVLRVR